MSNRRQPSDGQSRAECDRLALQYLDALEVGDLETVAFLWEQAAADPALERLLAELTDGAADEQGLPPVNDAAEQVRALLRRTMPSGFPAEAPPPLTIGDVAARLKADAAVGARLGDGDRNANERLLGDPRPVPNELGLPRFEKWRTTLGVVAGPHYWRVFRQTAVLLAMQRCQRTVELAAARQASAPKGGRL